MAITPTKISPTTSIAVMTSLPSWAAVFTASGITIAMLTDAEAMGRERSFGVAAPGGADGRARAESGGRRRPGLAVARQAVGPQLRAVGDQRRQVGDRLDRPRLRD